MGLTSKQKHWHSTGFHTLVAKTGPADQPGWLPLWAHLQDTEGIVEHLLSQWTPERVNQPFPGHISSQEWVQVCAFTFLVHDIGKAPPLFQAKITYHLPGAQDKL